MNIKFFSIIPLATIFLISNTLAVENNNPVIKAVSPTETQKLNVSGSASQTLTNDDSLQCTKSELKQFINDIISPIQEKINDTPTPEERCFDWTKGRELKKEEIGDKGFGGCVTQICGTLPGLNFDGAGLLDMLSDPFVALQKKLMKKLGDAFDKAKCAIIEAPTKLMQKIVTSGEKAAGEILGMPKDVRDSTYSGVDNKISNIIDKTLLGNKYIGKAINYTGESNLSGDIEEIFDEYLR